MHSTKHASDADPDRGPVTHPLPDGVVVDRSVRVSMRDGTRLAATVYRPDAEGRFPVVMCVTAYGKDFGPAEYTTLPRIKQAGLAIGTMEISDVTTWEGPDPGTWVPRGYAVMVVDPRGFYDSEGEAGFYTQQDVDDYADLIEWAGVQPWSSGSVGLNGVSYLAITQWMCASRSKPPHLKAIIPWEGVTDQLRDATHHGGIPESTFIPGWLAGSLARGAGEDIVRRGPAMIERAEREPFPLEEIDVPALVCASWSDQGLHTRGSIEGFKRIASEQKWLYTHGRTKWEVYYSPDAIEWQTSFFDHFLKGEDNGFDRRPRVRLETRVTRDEHDVRDEASWPPDGVRYASRYLDGEDGALVAEPPRDRRTSAYDARSGQVAFDLRFDRDTEVTGPMALKLWVSSPGADDLDLFVAVRKLDAQDRVVEFYAKDGLREGPVALGWLRASQRHLDPERTERERPFLSHDRSEKLAPGEVVPVQIEILPSSTAFRAGESLRLVVSGHELIDHPRFGHHRTVNEGQHVLHTGADRPSELLIPFCR